MRQDEGFDEAEAHDHHQPEAEQEVPDQPEPAGLRCLPGIDARPVPSSPKNDMAQAMTWTISQRVVVTDDGDVGRMEDPDEHVTNPGHQR